MIWDHKVRMYVLNKCAFLIWDIKPNFVIVFGVSKLNIEEKFFLYTFKGG